MTDYAHPMGWTKAIIGGLVYGGSLSGLVWLVWRAVTLAPVSNIGYAICGWLLVMGMSAVLLTEQAELDKIRKRGAIDIRDARKRRDNRTEAT